MITVDWAELKAFVDARDLSIQFVELSNKYILRAFDSYFILGLELAKESPASSDQADFENNYKAAGNKTLKHISNLPFDAKKLPDGKSLYRKVHGVKKTLSGDTTFDLVVPYDNAKITGVEVVWAPAGLQCDMKVYDTPTGTISTIPNLMLNQYGFDVGLGKDFYEENSNYDADLIKDMKIECLVKNPASLTDEICVNFILHEVKL
jgi:hypothetical protein